MIVGDGPSLNDLRARFPEVVFVGKQEGETLANTYAAADVFVFPSRTDTFGLVLLEAIASGLPVAAYPFPDQGMLWGNRGRRSLRRSWEGVSVSSADGAV